MLSLCCIYLGTRQCYRSEFTWMRALPITLFSSFFVLVKNYQKVKRPETDRQRLQRASEGLSIPKSLRSTFWSGAELLLFVLRITPEQYGREAYLQQKLFQNCVNKNIEKLYK